MDGDTVADFLVCPICHSLLRNGGERVYCANATCRRSHEGFPRVKGVPALIDFDRSVVAEAELIAHEGASHIDRGTGLWRYLSYRLHTLSGVQKAIDARAKLFLDCLRREHKNATVLIIGGGQLSPKSPFRTASDISFITSDIYYSDTVDVLADGHFLPLNDKSVHGVVAQSVIEHVIDPPTVAAEIHRVLCSRGLVYAETPFMQQVHEGALDFTRFTHSGHRWLFRNFDELHSDAAGGPSVTLLWSLRYLLRGLFRTKIAAVTAGALFFWLPFLDKLIPGHFSLDGASAVFFIGRKSSSSLSPRDMLAYYRGAGRR